MPSHTLPACSNTSHTSHTHTNHQCIERDVDRKDAIIQMLTRDLDDAEEQFQVAQRTHMEKMQRFTGLHNSKVAALEDEFERDLKALKTEFNTETKMIVSQHKREVKEMKAIISAVEGQEAERVAEAKQAHETEREEIRNKNLEGINELRINLENRIEELEKLFDEAHTNYREGTAVSNKQFQDLYDRDKKLSQFIALKRRQMTRFQNNLVYWKKKLENNTKECEARNAALKEQKMAILKHCNALKARMKRFRNNESKRLTELTVLSREALKKNQTKLLKAEKILQLAELARKFETEREKVLPFYESTVTDGMSNGGGLMKGDTIALESKVAMDGSGGGGKNNLRDQLDFVSKEGWNQLANFHKKYNKVLLDKLAIDQEKQRLQKENADLRSIMKQYLDGIAITEEVVDTDNPLLIVNGRVNLIDKQVRRTGMPVAVIEGTQTVNAYAVQRVNM